MTRYGERIFGHGALHFFFGRQAARRHRPVLGRMTEHLEGIVVVTSLEGVVMTVYRNDQAPRHLRCKTTLRRWLAPLGVKRGPGTIDSELLSSGRAYLTADRSGWRQRHIAIRLRATRHHRRSASRESPGRRGSQPADA